MDVSLLALPLAAPGAATAAPLSCKGFTVDPSALRIEAVLGNAETFTASIRLRARAAALEPVFLAGPLNGTGANPHTITPAAVTITTLAKPLAPRDARDLQVAVKGVRFAGTYHGLIRSSNEPSCAVALTVITTAAPEISLIAAPGQSALKLELATCSNLACGPGEALDFLDAQSSLASSFAPQVSNASQSSARITAVKVALARSPAGGPPAARAIAPDPEPLTLRAESAHQLRKISLRRASLAPGHYAGAIYLTLAGAEKRIALPLEVDVKVGPLWAIFWILLALLVQFLVWLASRNKPRRAESRAVRALDHELRHFGAADRELLEPLRRKARDLALDGHLDNCKAARGRIDGYVKALREAEPLKAASVGTGPLPQKIELADQALRAAIAKDEPTAAEAALQEMRTAVPAGVGADGEPPPVEPEAGATPGLPAGLVRFTVRVRSGFLAGAVRWLVRAGKAAIHSVGRAIVLFSIYVLPSLIRLILVFAFVLAGLKEVYFADTTFGTQPLVDYSALFLWGLTATALNVGLGKVIPDAVA